jgi:hypothetical protein
VDVSLFEGFEAGGYRIAGVVCCFCGERVAPGVVDPVTLVVRARSDRPRGNGLGAQTMWCHAECLEATGARNLHVTRPEFWEDADSEV